ncbi:MAG: hypothetical protein GKR87_07235 [Kiritimatiellae bacterium]|nr:hypothetical protein [Kiritimatiellia bacterium]
MTNEVYSSGSRHFGQTGPKYEVELMTTSQSIFKINASETDVEKIVADIQASVEKKIQEGVYADARIARAERSNLVHLKNEEQFLGFYLTCLRDAVFVDISDFDIRERRQGFAPILVAFKKIVWKLLKFYTYRLWVQQNQVNGLIVTAIEGVDEKNAAKIKQLEARIEVLEKEKS